MMFTQTTDKSRSRLLQSDSDVITTNSNLSGRLETNGDIPIEAADWDSHLLSQINQIRKHGERCDTIITSCSGTVFPAHSIILAASSDKLHTALPKETKHKYNLRLPVDDSTVKNFLDFVYTGKISCDLLQLETLQILAAQLCVDRLVKAKLVEENRQATQSSVEEDDKTTRLQTSVSSAGIVTNTDLRGVSVPWANIVSSKAGNRAGSKRAGVVNCPSSSKSEIINSALSSKAGIVSCVPSSKPNIMSSAPSSKAGIVSCSPSSKPNIINSALSSKAGIVSCAPSSKPNIINSALSSKAGIVSCAPLSEPNIMSSTSSNKAGIVSCNAGVFASNADIDTSTVSSTSGIAEAGADIVTRINKTEEDKSAQNAAVSSSAITSECLLPAAESVCSSAPFIEKYTTGLKQNRRDNEQYHTERGEITPEMSRINLPEKHLPNDKSRPCMTTREQLSQDVIKNDQIEEGKSTKSKTRKFAKRRRRLWGMKKPKKRNICIAKENTNTAINQCEILDCGSSTPERHVKKSNNTLFNDSSGIDNNPGVCYHDNNPNLTTVSDNEADVELRNSMSGDEQLLRKKLELAECTELNTVTQDTKSGYKKTHWKKNICDKSHINMNESVAENTGVRKSARASKTSLIYKEWSSSIGGIQSKKKRSTNKTKSNKETPFYCKYCGAKYISEVNLAIHENMHEEIKCHKCSYCDKIYWNRDSLNRHEEKHTGDNPYECITCGKICESAVALRSHERVHLRDVLTWRCKLCLLNFETRRRWLDHQNSQHGDVRLPHQCHECGLKFQERSHLKYHSQLHLRQHKCTYCAKHFASKSKLTEHTRIHTGENPYRCGFCQKAFSTSTRLIIHKINHHSMETDFPCTYCGKFFCTKNAAITHEQLHIHRLKGPYKCELCAKTFTTLSSLKVHKNIHERTYACSYCEKPFECDRKLKIHQRIHAGENPYMCDFCPKTFTSNTGLYLHKRKHSNKPPSFMCCYCSKCFVSKQSLITHELRHREKSPNFLCCYCSKWFFTKQGLNRHERKHSEKMSRNLCRYCNKCFPTKCRLKYHERSHIDKPFSCYLCRKTFTSSAALYCHKRIHNINLKQNKNNDSDHMCSICSRCFTSNKKMKLHEKTHTIMKHRCKICGRRFRQVEALKKHVKVHKSIKTRESI